MKLRNITVLILASIVASGCQINNLSGVTKKVTGKVLSQKDKYSIENKSFYLANGGDGNKRHTDFKKILGIPGQDYEKAIGSGKSAIDVEVKFLSDMKNKSIKLETNINIVSKKGALESAKIAKADYLIYSTVKKWVDPIGLVCMNGGSKYYADEAEVDVLLLNVNSGELISESNLYARDCPLVMNGIPMRKGSPELLHKDLFETWFSNNFKYLKKTR